MGDAFARILEDAILRGLGAPGGAEGEYRPAGKDARAPDFRDHVGAIGAPDEAGGEIRYEDAEGRKTASRDENPVLYADVVVDYETQQGMRRSEAEGYRRATDNEVWSDYAGIQCTASGWAPTAAR